VKILGWVTGVFVIVIAVVDDGEVFQREAGGVDVEDVAIVIGALLEATVVSEDDGAAVIRQAKEGDVIFGNAQAGSAGTTGQKVDVRLDADDSRMVGSARGGSGVSGLEGFELFAGRIILREVAIDEVIVGQGGDINGCVYWLDLHAVLRAGEGAREQNGERNQQQKRFRAFHGGVPGILCRGCLRVKPETRDEKMETVGAGKGYPKL